MSERLLFTALSGWAIVSLIAMTISLPYVSRTSRSSAVLRLHYWIGYAIVTMGLVHATASMTRGIVTRAHLSGIYIATAALLVILIQVLVGLVLRRRGGSAARQGLRRAHFWLMVAIVTAGIIHLGLDSVVLGTFS